MVPIIHDNFDAMIRLCRSHGVQRLEIFGSALRDDFDPAASDLDFLVEFSPMEPCEHARAYFGLMESFQDLFGRQIDLVETAAIRNPYFRDAVNRERVEVYAA